MLSDRACAPYGVVVTVDRGRPSAPANTKSRLTAKAPLQPVAKSGDHVMLNTADPRAYRHTVA